MTDATWAPRRDPGADPGGAAAGVEGPGHRRYLRRERGRIVAGVAGGLAEHLRLDVRAVRFAFVALNVVMGAGILAYGMFWFLVPSDASGAAEDERDRRGRTPGRLLVAGVVLLVLGCLVLLDGSGPGRALFDLVPFVAVAVGAVVAWRDVDADGLPPWLAPRARGGVVRVVAGAVLAVGGLIVFATRGQGLAMAWDVTLATLAVLGGLALVLAPWGLRFWSRYQEEQASRIRETERADLAAHLHDSVLQTLALIQRTDEPGRAAGLARAQERELRAWLYGGPQRRDDTVAAAVAAAAHEVEDRHGLPVDLVVTGDRALDRDGEALVAALREALLNAVRHGAPPVSAYVEVGPRRVEAFVRDHGPGFDLDAVPEDRLGVRESLLARMERHGGHARIRRLEEGTEVELVLPVPAPDDPAPDRPAEPAEERTP